MAQPYNSGPNPPPLTSQRPTLPVADSASPIAQQYQGVFLFLSIAALIIGIGLILGAFISIYATLNHMRMDEVMRGAVYGSTPWRQFRSLVSFNFAIGRILIFVSFGAYFYFFFDFLFTLQSGRFGALHPDWQDVAYAEGAIFNFIIFSTIILLRPGLFPPRKKPA